MSCKGRVLSCVIVMILLAVVLPDSVFFSLAVSSDNQHLLDRNEASPQWLRSAGELQPLDSLALDYAAYHSVTHYQTTLLGGTGVFRCPTYFLRCL